MKRKRLLTFYLVLMGALIGLGLLFPKAFLAFFDQPDLYLTAKFVHIVCVTLFFANVVIGTLWETRSLVSGKPEVIRFTYDTVTWLDAVFTAPLILLSILSGIMLGTILGGVWTIGWLSIAFCLFLGSGVFWIVADIPTQYKVNKLFVRVEPGSSSLPRELTRLLWLRMGINLLSIAPLLFIFFLMVHKPELPRVSSLLHFF